MKKLLVLNYEFPPLGGGASPVSYELTEALSLTGDYDIDVVTMGYDNLPADEEINANFRIHRVRCLRSRKEICHPWEQLTYLWSGYRKCQELLTQKKFDLCHCHFIIPTGWLAYRLWKKYGLPYVITSHGSDVLGYNPRFRKLYPLLRKTWRQILDHTRMVTTPSEFLRQEILKTAPLYDETRIVVIPNGIKEGRFKPMQKEKYILLVSRLFVNKGIQDLLAAIKGLDLGEWRVKIVGDGPYRLTLEQMVRDYNLSSRVEFIGWIDRNDQRLSELYGHAEIFVSTSYFESFGMTLLEALQAGAQPLVTDIPVHMDIVQYRVFSFRPGKTDELSNKLKEKMSAENNKIPSIDRFYWTKIVLLYDKTFNKQ